MLDNKNNIKNKYTKMQNTALTFFQRMNKQPPFCSKCYHIYNKEKKHLKPFSGYINYIIFIIVTSTTKIKIDNISSCQTLNLDQFTNFLQ